MPATRGPAMVQHRIEPAQRTDTARCDETEWLLAQSGWMHSLARDLIGDRALAEDVVQDAWAVALAHGPLEPRTSTGGARAWLAGVVGNLARRARGREARRPGVEERGARPEAQASAEELVARMELQRELAVAVLALDEPYRSAVLWRHLSGLPAHEIARRQGCSDEAARQRVARGLARLRQTLDARHGRRSAWATALAPLAAAAPAVLANAFPLGGLLMGSKSIVALVAGVSLVALTLVTLSRRSVSERTPVTAPFPAAPGERNEGLGARLAPAPAAAREPSPARAAPAAAPVELTGLVHDSRGWPLARASVVRVEDEDTARALVRRALPDERCALTDELGGFRLAPGAAERTVLWVLCPGYIAKRVETSGPAPLAVVLAAHPTVEVVLRPPDGLAPESDAPADARLWVRRADGSEETVAVEPDAGGRLVARNLPLGRLERARGRQRGFGRAERALDLALAPDGAVLVELELPRGSRLRGIVLDARTEQPIAGAEVWAEEAWLGEGSPAPLTRTDEHGRFELVGVELERSDESRTVWCIVSARAEGFVAQRLDLRSWPENEQARYWTELRLEPADACLRGRVLLPDGAPVAALVLGVDERDEFHVVQADADGLFTMEGLPEGTLELLANTREIPGLRAELRTRLAFRPGETRSEELRLETSRGVVRGRLHTPDGGPVAGAELRLNHNMNTTRVDFGVEERVTTTDGAGRFEFPGCPAGEHFLRVVAAPGGLVSEPGPGDFQLGEGETRNVELVCAPAIELGGHVELVARSADPDARVLDPASLRVVARKVEGGAHLAESVVAADGAFLFPSLYPTRIELVLLAGDEELSRTSAGPGGSRELLLSAER